MKFLLSSLCLMAVLAVVFGDADSGHFIPKAFYTLDSDGHKSDVHPINTHTAHYLRRLRRQTVSSSSSSSSVSSGGGPVFFTSKTVNSNTPSDVGFASRFGGESSAPVGISSTSTSTSSGNGPVFFTSKTVSSNTPGNVGFASRFGGDSTASGGNGNSVSSSSSSTSSSSDGGPVFFSSKTVNSHSPADVGFASRFGGDSPASVGHIVETTGVIHNDGKIYYDTKESDF